MLPREDGPGVLGFAFFGFFGHGGAGLNVLAKSRGNHFINGRIPAGLSEIKASPRSMPDGPERHALFTRMNAIVKEEAPMIQLWNPTLVGLAQLRVRNLKLNPMFQPSFKYFDVDQGP